MPGKKRTLRDLSDDELADEEVRTSAHYTAKSGDTTEEQDRYMSAVDDEAWERRRGSRKSPGWQKAYDKAWERVHGPIPSEKAAEKLNWETKAGRSRGSMGRPK